eukprot:3177037-Rhodomonas_salina.2
MTFPKRNQAAVMKALLMNTLPKTCGYLHAIGDWDCRLVDVLRRCNGCPEPSITLPACNRPSPW